MKLSDIRNVSMLKECRDDIMTRCGTFTGSKVSHFEITADNSRFLIHRDAYHDDEKALFETIRTAIYNFFDRRLTDNSNDLKALGVSPDE